MRLSRGTVPRQRDDKYPARKMTPSLIGSGTPYSIITLPMGVLLITFYLARQKARLVTGFRNRP
jgi:hypothetical protein